MNFPIQNGDFNSYVKLPEGSSYGTLVGNTSSELVCVAFVFDVVLC